MTSEFKRMACLVSADHKDPIQKLRIISLRLKAEKIYLITKDGGLVEEAKKLFVSGEEIIDLPLGSAIPNGVFYC